MARKRGGLAGIWDRNKGIIQKAVPAALSFVPGVGVPLAAASGALMRGLDRPGKSGIGFDVGQGIRGGLEGAAIGAGTQTLAGGVKGLLTAGAPKAAGGGAAPFDFSGSGIGANPLDVTKSPVRDIAGMTDSAGSTPKQSRLQGLLKGARENKDLLTMAGKGLQAALPQQERQSDIMAAETQRMNAETQRRFSEFQMQQTTEQQQREEERRRAILQFLSPYIRQNAPMLNPGAFGDLG